MTSDASDDSSSSLLVFGYSCKLFRDDERAQNIEEGNHLIPWMGRSDLLIDRYDGRGHLYSLSEHQSKDGEGEEGDDRSALLSLMSAAERAEEEACQEERYWSIVEEDEAEAASREEEDKRMMTGGAQNAGFAYNYENPPQQQQQHQRHQEPPSLRVLANCIEKTAEFIAKQGAQMEILMRAKEAGNPKFQFLNPDNPYHPIYKEVLEKKRSRPRGTFGDSAANLAALARQTSLEVERSLREVMANMPTAAPNIMGSASSATAPTTSNNSSSAYSKLVERIRVNQRPLPGTETPPKVATPPPPPNAAATPSQSQQAPKEKKNAGVSLEEGEVLVTPPPITMQPLIDKTAAYVARHSAHADKLAVVRKRDPDGFAFLNPDNKYNLFYQYKVALYKEMLAERGHDENSAAGLKNGSGSQPTATQQREPTHEEQMQQVASKFPSLKGFFR